MTDAPEMAHAHILNQLLSRGHEFSFVQVLRLARKILESGKRRDLPDVSWLDKLRIRPELSLAFPAADVGRVEQTEDGLSITATFLSLYGSSSPLPTFYTEELLAEAAEDRSALRGFYDLFHQRLYQLYFQCWNKYNLLYRMVEEEYPLEQHRLLCLIGLAEDEMLAQVPDGRRMLRYVGLLSTFPRSAYGLKAMLEELLAPCKVRIAQNIFRRVPIPPDQRLCLGVSGCRLGVDAVLGSHVDDIQGKFRIEIGPLTWEQYNNLLPGTVLHDKLSKWVRFYVTSPLDVDLRLILAAGEARPLRLGDPEARLGLNSWSFAGDSLGEVSALFPLADFRSTSPESDGGPAKTSTAGAEKRSFVQYYRQELAALARLQADYVAEHPRMASMIHGHAADPGVQRLTEGAALMNALLQWQIEDDLPDFIRLLTQVLHPRYLRSIPAATIVAFTPRFNCTTSQQVPAGTRLDSEAVAGTACRFTTNGSVELHPLTLHKARWVRPPGHPAAILLDFELHHIPLADWRPESLRLFLGGDYPRAADLHLLLTRHLSRIKLTAGTGDDSCVLGPDCVQPVAWRGDAGEMAFVAGGVVQLGMLRDFSLLPEKFLFLDVYGWRQWQPKEKSANFTVAFEFDRLPGKPPEVSRQDFVLGATPAENIFPRRARPITVQEAGTEYQVVPEGQECGAYEVHAVEQVTGITKAKGEPLPFKATPWITSRPVDGPVYQVSSRPALLRPGFDTFLTIKLPDAIPMGDLSGLSVDMLCTNGTLPNGLKAGSLTHSTDNSPAFATFSNCKPVVGALFDALEVNYFWHLKSISYLNLRLMTAKSLRGILQIIGATVLDNGDGSRCNDRRIDGIVGFTIEQTGRVIRGVWCQGWQVDLTLQRSSFCSTGDLVLFGSLVHRFLGQLVSVFYFLRTFLRDSDGSLLYEFPIVFGKRPGL